MGMYIWNHALSVWCLIVLYFLRFHLYLFWTYHPSGSVKMFSSSYISKSKYINLFKWTISLRFLFHKYELLFHLHTKWYSALLIPAICYCYPQNQMALQHWIVYRRFTWIETLWRNPKEILDLASFISVVEPSPVHA